MFERFTDRARRVVVLAQEEARLLNHNYIGTEHILLGLLHEGEGVAAQAMTSLGISLDHVRAEVRAIIGLGGQPPSGHIPFTPRAKKVLELSLREALHLSHNYIGTEHILLGVIREGEGVAAQVLVKLGADLTTVRQRIIQLLSTMVGGDPPIVGDRIESFEMVPEHHEGFGAALASTFAAVFSAAERCTLCDRDLFEAAHFVRGSLGVGVCETCVAAAHAAMVNATVGQREVLLAPRVIGEEPADGAVAAVMALIATLANSDIDERAVAEVVEQGDLVPPVLMARGPMRVLEAHVIAINFLADEIAIARVRVRHRGQPFTVVEGGVVHRDDRWLLSRDLAIAILTAA